MNPEELLTATGFVPHVFRTRATLVINENMPQEVERFGSSVLPGTQMEKSAVYVPLVIGDQVRGVIIIMDVEHEHAFSDSDVRLLQTLANSMSVALENARLFNETQRLLKETEQRAAELVTINTVSAALTGELEVNALIHLVGEQTRATFNADIIYVALLDEVHGVINFPYTYGEELTPLQSGEGLTSKILQMNQLLLINQGLELQTQELGATLVGKQSQSYLGVPIVINGKAVGVLSVQSTTQEGLFDQDDARLLSTIASNVGTALHNAQLFTEVQNQRKFSEALIDFLPDATLVIDREGRVIAWNRAIEEMTGIQAENMLGKNNYEYALPFYGERRPILIDLVLMPRDEFEAKYAQIQRKGETLIGETYTPSLRGGRYMYATASVFHDARGDSVGAIETIRDITERKQAEVELQKAKDAADAANATKSAFLANMSHELRTPLNAIIGFTRIVRRKADGLIPEKQTDNLDKVLASAEHLLNLINTVLDIAKIESGRMDVLAANFRINALIDLCANTAQPLLRPGVNLEKQMDENLSIIHSDQDKIRQIILNLLSNAAKFTHEGKIILATHRDGKYLRVSVSDTGIGISDEARLHIFKEFQQADTSTTRQYGGTGLGLSISRNLAHLLGGDLTVESELGIGSTFTLVIPMQYGSGAASTPDRESAPVPGNDQRRASDATKKRILVIDDDPDAVYLLQENLNQNEFLITGARTGRDGLRSAREQPPQAILLDILMPETDGWQILNELKQDAATANIPVILLTIVDKKALGFRLGAAAYLLKPLDPVAVRDALNRVIGQDDRQQKYILVVDDDPSLADILRQFLPESEFRVASALDGLAGLEAIEAERPDILLLDIMMPRLDGFGVIEKLRANLQTRDLPIIVISAKDLTVEEAARLKETVAFVMKKQGFQGEQLLEEINSVLTA
jgi:PAS domain S-box-containing protein